MTLAPLQERNRLECPRIMTYGLSSDALFLACGSQVVKLPLALL